MFTKKEKKFTCTGVHHFFNEDSNVCKCGKIEFGLEYKKHSRLGMNPTTKKDNQIKKEFEFIHSIQDKIMEQVMEATVWGKDGSQLLIRNVLYDTVVETLSKQRTELRKEIEKMGSVKLHFNKDCAESYNQALSDILKIMSEEI